MALSAEQIARVNQITQKGRSFEAQLGRLEDHLASPDIDPVNAKMRLTIITTLHRDLLRYNDELASLQEDNPHLISFPTIESRYFNAASQVTKMQRDAPLANSTMNASNITLTERHELPRLPEIKLPTFDGSRQDWANYKHKFEALVHSRTDLSETVKCSQLFATLKGSALAKVEQFDPSAADYPRAWKTLLDFYDHKRIVAIEHLNAILDLPVLNKATATDLSMLLDKARQHLHILERLQIDPGEPLVVRIIERCLPPAIRSRWHDKLELDELPTREGLFKFIQTAIFKLQSVDAQSTSNSMIQGSRKRSSEMISQFQTKNPKLNVRSFVTTSNATSSMSESSALPPCSKCSEKHRLYRCPAFHNLNPSERRKFVQSNKICLNCLCSHPFPCKSQNRCKKCNYLHHTLLHLENKPKQLHFQKYKVEGASSTSSSTSTAPKP